MSLKCYLLAKLATRSPGCQFRAVQRGAKNLIAERLTGNEFTPERADEHAFFHIGPTICQVA